MKIKIARRIVLVLPLLLVIVGLAFATGTGTLSSFGWQQISLICPLGVLGSFLASLMGGGALAFLPHALIMIVILLIIGAVLGKVFCGWICPVPPLRRFFDRFRPKKKQQAQELALTEAELKDLKGAASGCGAKGGCAACAEKRHKLDSRHIVLGGAIVSSVAFGFPVFCLVCPVGLTFATVIALWRMVGFAELSWSLLVFPLILVVEVVFLRKWCNKICPLGAVMSLLGLTNRLFRPKVDKTKCLRENGVECQVCSQVCPEHLDPHFGTGMHECSKCGECVAQCPAHAISIPFAPHKEAPMPEALPERKAA
jgi:ferredoxin-type protein NapH